MEHPASSPRSRVMEIMSPPAPPSAASFPTLTSPRHRQGQSPSSSSTLSSDLSTPVPTATATPSAGAAAAEETTNEDALSDPESDNHLAQRSRERLSTRVRLLWIEHEMQKVKYLKSQFELRMQRLSELERFRLDVIAVLKSPEIRDSSSDPTSTSTSQSVVNSSDLNADAEAEAETKKLKQAVTMLETKTDAALLQEFQKIAKLSKMIDERVAQGLKMGMGVGVAMPRKEEVRERVDSGTA